jgi:hypothetical protein
VRDSDVSDGGFQVGMGLVPAAAAIVGGKPPGLMDTMLVVGPRKRAAFKAGSTRRWGVALDGTWVRV